MIAEMEEIIVPVRAGNHRIADFDRIRDDFFWDTEHPMAGI